MHSSKGGVLLSFSLPAAFFELPATGQPPVSQRRCMNEWLSSVI